MTLYNYKDFLSLDDQTYDAWEPRFTRIENQALFTVRDLAPDFDIKKPNEAVHAYCEEVMFMTLYGDDLSTSLFNYHDETIRKMEARFKYTTEWRSDS